MAPVRISCSPGCRFYESHDWLRCCERLSGCRMAPQDRRAWLAELSTPATVVHEVGPADFGRSRMRHTTGARSEVAAPLRLHAPSCGS